MPELALAEPSVSIVTNAPSHGLRRASFCTRPVQKRKSSSSHFDSQKKPKMSRARRLSAGFPEYVSTRHFRNSLRHGASRCPRVAFQMNFSAPNKLSNPPTEHSSAGTASTDAPLNACQVPRQIQSCLNHSLHRRRLFLELCR
jgi:hypothetical protein